MNLAQILETVQALQSERDALKQCAAEEIDLESAEYFILDVLTDKHEWDTTYFRHNSKGLVYSFAALYYAGRTCRIQTVKRMFPNSYTGTVVDEEVFTPADGFCGFTGRA